MITILTEQYQSRVETNPLNIIKTGFIFLTWIVLSIHIELIAPTMTVLAKNVNVTYDGMGTVLASRDAGYLIASILGAVLQNIVEKYSDGILIFAFILSAIVTFVTPFLRSVILLCVLFVIQGIAEGFTELGGTSLILFMWKEKSAAPLNIIHFGYGIGAIIINLVVQPFLKKDISTGHSNIIIIPYIITAMLCALIAVGYVVFFIKALRNRRERIEIRIDTNEENSSFAYLPRICGHGYFGYGLTLSMIFILSLFCITGNDQTFSKFFFTFLKLDKFKTTPGVATWGISLYWLSYSVGQLIIAIVSVFVSVEICLNTVWFGALCVAIAWLIFKCIIGLTGTSLIILGTLTGLVISPINPLTFALFNQRLNVVPILLSLVLCGSALGGIVFEKLAGFIMDHNPNHFPTLLILGIAVSICLYLIANIIYVFHRHKPSSQSLNQRKETVSIIEKMENIDIQFF